MAEGIASTPEAGLKQICSLARELQIYGQCVHYYPFVLGAQPVRPIDLARFYATVASEGLLPDTHVIEAISDQSQRLFAYAPPQVKRIQAADAAAFYQLKSMLQGVVLRGTAARLSTWAPYIAGKTGTTNEETDAWFVGFSNEVTVAVWVGYDNIKKKETLGRGRTGGNVAVPIFAPIMEAVWRDYAPKTPLAPPRDAAVQLIAGSDAESKSSKSSKNGFGIVEYLRKVEKGKVSDKRYALISQPSSQSTQRPRSRDNFQNGYASARTYQPEPAQEQQRWGWFGAQSGWSNPSPFGQGMFGQGPSTFGQGGGYWSR